jgi:hypothetical protein
MRCEQECDNYKEFWAGAMKNLGYNGYTAATLLLH